MRHLCIYHGNCFDGFTAAWIYRRWFSGSAEDETLEFHPGIYGEIPPMTKIMGSDVTILDFSYKRDLMEAIAEASSSLLILDHHKTAEAELVGLEAMFGDRFHGKVRVEFDMHRSGAGMAWDYFFPAERRLKFVDYVEDRDLWRFALPHSREIHSAIASYPFNFEQYDLLTAWAETEGGLQALVNMGETIERKHWQDIRALLPVVTRTMVLGGHRVPVANMPITMTSDAGHLLAEAQPPFAACYWDTPTGRVFSLRSIGDFDVSEIAKAYGGGGHKNAAGFEMPRNWEGD